MEAWDEFVHRAMDEGCMSSGHHNRNFLLRLDEALAKEAGLEAGSFVTVRSRRPDALRVVVRTWQDEAEILAAAGAVLPHVPKCLARSGGATVHSYVEGVPLSTVCPNGRAVDRVLVDALVDRLAQATRVRRGALPVLPSGWPEDDEDSRGFLRLLATEVDRQVCQSNWAEFGDLFKALGIPRDVMIRYADRVPPMTRRPYGLLHADLHRDNVILTYSGEPPLFCVDWELATYGDPLHDLAVHLVRMRYPESQEKQVIAAWKRAVRRVSPAAARGLDEDLRHYIDFERAQSVFPDVMRVAQSLDAFVDQRDLDRATTAVRRALEAAAGPLGLDGAPDGSEIVRALVEWRKRQDGRHVRFRSLATVDWSPDCWASEDHSAVRALVHEALIKESVAPEHRVLRGTAHRNSVVHVAGLDRPVVVRRRMRGIPTRELGLLDEHAVLRTIERSGVRVEAPRVLALGTSDEDGFFALHTYVGPTANDGPPDHPVLGLRPYEADALVDQLCALTEVDHSSLGPAAGEGDFCRWLSDRLVQLVADLPLASRRLAQQLGLPDDTELKEILYAHEVTHRRPALLHGDLNPWNLVRREGKPSLALVDWERAMVGDPVYDLVRHMHLTPTPTRTRERMLSRWTDRLAAEYTEGWQDDLDVYRRLEVVRSAYVDLDRLVTRATLDAPNVSRAVDSYAATLRSAKVALGLPDRPTQGPSLLFRALPEDRVRRFMEAAWQWPRATVWAALREAAASRPFMASRREVTARSTAG
ncbi:aminoglycoside phosphotransferase family protein [Streptomyces sp. NPDC002845]